MLSKESRANLTCLYKNHWSIFPCCNWYLLTLATFQLQRDTMQGCGLSMVSINVQLVNGHFLI